MKLQNCCANFYTANGGRGSIFSFKVQTIVFGEETKRIKKIILNIPKFISDKHVKQCIVLEKRVHAAKMFLFRMHIRLTWNASSWWSWHGYLISSANVKQGTVGGNNDKQLLNTWVIHQMKISLHFWSLPNVTVLDWVRYFWSFSKC